MHDVEWSRYQDHPQFTFYYSAMIKDIFVLATTLTLLFLNPKVFLLTLRSRPYTEKYYTFRIFPFSFLFSLSNYDFPQTDAIPFKICTMYMVIYSSAHIHPWGHTHYTM